MCSPIHIINISSLIFGFCPQANDFNRWMSHYNRNNLPSTLLPWLHNQKYVCGHVKLCVFHNKSFICVEDFSKTYSFYSWAIWLRPIADKHQWMSRCLSQLIIHPPLTYYVVHNKFSRYIFVFHLLFSLWVLTCTTNQLQALALLKQIQQLQT